MFCHRYYLRHLCDEACHAGWPLDDHVQLLQVSVCWVCVLWVQVNVCWVCVLCVLWVLWVPGGDVWEAGVSSAVGGLGVVFGVCGRLLV